MTPNHKNIGAAPEEYPVLVRTVSGRTLRPLNVGEVIQEGDVCLAKDVSVGVLEPIPVGYSIGKAVKPDGGNNYYRPIPSQEGEALPTPKAEGSPSPSPEELIKDLAEACWKAMTAMGSTGANSDTSHSMRGAWETCRAALAKAGRV